MKKNKRFCNCIIWQKEKNGQMPTKKVSTVKSQKGSLKNNIVNMVVNKLFYLYGQLEPCWSDLGNKLFGQQPYLVPAQPPIGLTITLQLVPDWFILEFIPSGQQPYGVCVQLLWTEDVSIFTFVTLFVTLFNAKNITKIHINIIITEVISIIVNINNKI